METWFSLPGRTARAPPKWKMFLVSATVFYLLNLTLSLIYGWALNDWPLFLHIVVISVPVTAIATWLVMPRAARGCRSGSTPRPANVDPGHARHPPKPRHPAPINFVGADRTFRFWD